MYTLKQLVLTICFGLFIFTQANAQIAKWTFLVYLDADNNLEPFGIDDINEMEVIGSTADVNIVVQMDRAPGYDNTNGDWTSTKRYLVTKGTNNTLIESPTLMDIGEANMGDPTTLTDFLKWGATAYPAQHYALVLWNHGGGWQKKKGSSNGVFKDICIDETNNDVLKNAEVLSGIAISGIHLDVMGYDACLMGMMENAYQLRDFVDVMVASEETEPGAGWPYTTILQDLTTTPIMSPSTFGQTIVTKYAEYYTTDGSPTTQSAIDLSKISDVVLATKEFAAAALLTDSTNWVRIIEARNQTNKYYFPENKDLGYFAHLVSLNATDVTLQQKASALENSINQSVILFKPTGLSYVLSQGLAVYFPDVSNYNTVYGESINEISFIKDSDWNTFLKESFKHDFDNGNSNTLDANEPNSTWAMATPLNNNNPITGYIESYDDYDFFRFEVPDTSRISLKLQVTADYLLILTSINGSKQTDIQYTFNDGSNVQEIDTTLPKGVYYALIAAATPTAVSSTPYEISISNIKTLITPTTYTATLAYDLSSPNIASYGTTINDAIACQFSLISNTAKLNKIWVLVYDLFLNEQPGNNYFEVFATDNYGDILNAPMPCTPSTTGWKSFDVSDQDVSLFGNFTIGVRFDGVNAPGIAYDSYASFGNTIFYSTDYVGGFIEEQGTYSIRADISYTRYPSEITGIGSSTSQHLNYSTYPNPCTDYIIINSEKQLTSITNIEIYDTFGKLVNTSTFNPLLESRIKIDTKSFSKGVYFYTIKNDETTITGKFIKQ